MKEFGELMRAIDEDLDHCIQKFRNATSGHDARIFVSEYEELMMRKSQLIADICIKKEWKALEKRVADLEDKVQSQPKLDFDVFEEVLRKSLTDNLEKCLASNVRPRKRY